MDRLERIMSHLAQSATPVLTAVPTQGVLARPIFSKDPIRVAVTGAAGQIGYSLLPMIAEGKAFGEDQPIILHLLEVPAAEKMLKGVVMELLDGAFPLLFSIVPTSDPAVAFKDIDYAVLVGAFPRKAGMERGDLLQKNASIFKEQGMALEKFASKNVKVLVVGNPANTNALICSHFAPSIPKENFSALTRLDHHRALAQIAGKLQVPVASIKNVIIWGNHSATQVPDLTFAIVDTITGQKPIAPMIQEAWLPNFTETVQKRGAAVIAARGASSALSAARATAAHLRSWHLGTAPGEWTSMGVISSGEYGAPANTIYSFPVTIQNGKWTIVKSLKLTESVKAAMVVTGNELVEERRLAIGI